jgi:hypothetical protein
MSADTREMLEILLALAPWVAFIALLILASVGQIVERLGRPAERARKRSHLPHGDREGGGARS